MDWEHHVNIPMSTYFALHTHTHTITYTLRKWESLCQLYRRLKWFFFLWIRYNSDTSKELRNDYGKGQTMSALGKKVKFAMVTIMTCDNRTLCSFYSLKHILCKVGWRSWLQLLSHLEPMWLLLRGATKAPLKLALRHWRKILLKTSLGLPSYKTQSLRTCHHYILL